MPDDPRNPFVVVHALSSRGDRSLNHPFLAAVFQFSPRTLFFTKRRRYFFLKKSSNELAARRRRFAAQLIKSV